MLSYQVIRCHWWSYQFRHLHRVMTERPEQVSFTAPSGSVQRSRLYMHYHPNAIYCLRCPCTHGHKKTRYLHQTQYNLAKRFYSYRLPQHCLPLKACQDLCGLRDSQRTRLFLNNHGLDRVIFGDNDKTLLREKGRCEEGCLRSKPGRRIYLSAWPPKGGGGVQNKAETRDKERLIVSEETDSFLP